MEPLAWRRAWHDALYSDERGFYRRPEGPAGHFATAAHGPTGPVLAQALMRHWAHHCRSDVHGHEPEVVVDLGAGRGELTTLLLAELDNRRSGTNGTVATPPHRGKTTRVVAVDVIERPDGLDERVEWLRSPGGAELPEALRDLRGAFVIAHEWLDVVPCTVAQVGTDGNLRTVLVDPGSGQEKLGEPLRGDERLWCDAYWPAAEPGDRVEVGWQRDRAWQDLLSRVTHGLVVAVDYGHRRESRPRFGTLTGYRDGSQVEPVPDGSCDLTAHVAVDSLTADHTVLQREVLQQLGFAAQLPEHELATRDPLLYLESLQRCSAEAALIEAHGFGGFWWVSRHVRGDHHGR